MGMAKAKDVWPALQALLGLEHLKNVREATIKVVCHGPVVVSVEAFAEAPDGAKGPLQERRFEVVEIGSANGDVFVEKLNAERERMTDERRCKNCKHWEKSPHLPPHGECVHPKMQVMVDEDWTPDSAGTSRDLASIETGPEFGCVHWKGKP